MTQEQQERHAIGVGCSVINAGSKRIVIPDGRRKFFSDVTTGPSQAQPLQDVGYVVPCKVLIVTGGDPDYYASVDPVMPKYGGIAIDQPGITWATGPKSL